MLPYLFPVAAQRQTLTCFCSADDVPCRSTKPLFHSHHGRINQPKVFYIYISQLLMKSSDTTRLRMVVKILKSLKAGHRECSIKIPCVRSECDSSAKYFPLLQRATLWSPTQCSEIVAFPVQAEGLGPGLVPM